MKCRWYYWRRMFRRNRPVRMFLVCGIMYCAVTWFWGMRGTMTEMLRKWYIEYGVAAATHMMEVWFPSENDSGLSAFVFTVPEVVSYLGELEDRNQTVLADDPAYVRLLAEWEAEMIRKEGEEWQNQNVTNARENEEIDSAQMDRTFTSEAIASKPVLSTILREKLADYDYMIQSFYSIHPTTTASRESMDAEVFLTADLSITQDAAVPQVLIYHTHSQEAFADFPENPQATIVGVGARLADLLRTQGYQVIHDTSVYDMRDGKLDRNQAYTYALEGITGILQKYPTIQVVLDLHRDGVDENTRLVTEVNGKPTAKIMFFNGTSRTPDGPIEYLPNPNHSANMAFSFQMQLKAAEQYPGFTRKIYLKGLRYNQHVRARTALVEVGAQTNTYAEALNAMEPLADILCQVLKDNN